MRGAARIVLPSCVVLSLLAPLHAPARAQCAPEYALSLRSPKATPVPMMVSEGEAGLVPASPRRSAPAWSVLEEPVFKGSPSPTTARNASIAATVIPLVAGGAIAAGGNDGVGGTLAGYGVFVGPAAGWWYADHNARGWGGVGTRALISLGTAVVAAVIVGPPRMKPGSELSEDSREHWAWTVATGGALAVVSSAVWDIVSVERVVRRDNAGRAVEAP